MDMYRRTVTLYLKSGITIKVVVASDTTGIIQDTAEFITQFAPSGQYYSFEDADNGNVHHIGPQDLAGFTVGVGS